jgi:hypothetical protein
MEILAFILDNLKTIGAIVSAVLVLATLVTGLTPSPKDDEVVRKIAGFLSFLTPKDAPGTFKLPMTPPPAARGEGPLLQERPSSNVTSLRRED